MKTRLTADERRDEVIAAAAIEFAAGGFAGTSTGAIAKRAGVSQPYLFQLFGTKQELVLAAVRDCFVRTTRRFEEAARSARAAGLDGTGVLKQVGDEYVKLLLADRDLLRVQLHAYAACGDPEIRAVVRAEWITLWQTVARLSGSEPAALYQWFANGMLINVIASIGEAGTLDEFNAMLYGGTRPDAAGGPTEAQNGRE
jgi:AcrR family transcriptional regulator